MCGIIGLINRNREGPEKALNMLLGVEQRGYHNQGIALLSPGEQPFFVRTKGILTNEDKEKVSNVKASIHLAHTRWATHGNKEEKNAHPHFDLENKVAVVMNGTIDNARKIRAEMGLPFLSQTDTEIIPNKISEEISKIDGLDEDRFLKATARVVEELLGRYAFIASYNGIIIGYRNDNNPLNIGIENDSIIACSEIEALEPFSDNNTSLEPKEFFLATKNSSGKLELKFYNSELREIEKKFRISDRNKKIRTKEGYKTFLEQEINMQSRNDELLTTKNIDTLHEISKAIRENGAIYIVGAGTSYNMGHILARNLKKAGFNAIAVKAANFDEDVEFAKGQTVIAISQSGETSDIIGPLRKLTNTKTNIFGITNSPNSELDRIAQKCLYLGAPKEISVASTMTCTRTLLLSSALEDMLKTEKLNFKRLITTEEIFYDVLKKNKEVIERVAKILALKKTGIIAGRRSFEPVADEAALKLKEITRLVIHSENIGEFKHGPINLVKQGENGEIGTPTIVIGDDNMTMTNVEQIKANGGYIIGMSATKSELYDEWIELPEDIKLQEYFGIVLSQILTVRTARELGFSDNEIDHPINLAKTVTVE